MRKLAALGVGLAILFIAFASIAAALPAMASTAVPVSMKFTEPLLQDVNSGCPVLGLPFPEQRKGLLNVVCTRTC